MERILVVLRGPLSVEMVRTRCAVDVASPYEMAVCRVLPDGSDSLEGALLAQRETTAALRDAIGDQAEHVAVLVASERDGYRVEDCARDWGATVVET